MQYKAFKDGIQLSRLGMGVMRLPVNGSDAEIDYEKAHCYNTPEKRSVRKK